MLMGFRGFAGKTFNVLKTKSFPRRATSSLSLALNGKLLGRGRKPVAIPTAEISSTSSTPPAATPNDVKVTGTLYSRGQSIQVLIQKFGPLGASVSVENGVGDQTHTFGLVLQSEIALLREKRGSDILIGETIPAYVERVREDGRLNVSFRPIDVPRIKDTAEQILEALEGSPSMSIPVGDKSSPEDISAYFYGITKSDFKKAVGLLYKQGIAKPGPFTTVMIPEEERDGSVTIKRPVAAAAAPAPAPAAAASSISQSVRETSKPVVAKTKSFDAPKFTDKSNLAERLNSQRGEISKTIFIGNLHISSCTPELLAAEFGKRMDMSRIKPPIRIALDEEQKPRGFAYLEMRDQDDVDYALAALKGLKLRDRVVRLDYADPEMKTKKVPVASPVESGAVTVRQLLDNRASTAEPISKAWTKPTEKVDAIGQGSNRPTAATLYMGNLSYKAGVSEITAFLEVKTGPGAVKSVRLATDPVTGRKKGFAFVDFFVEDDAKRCFDELHEADFMGRNVLIDDATRRDS